MNSVYPTVLLTVNVPLANANVVHILATHWFLLKTDILKHLSQISVNLKLHIRLFYAILLKI